MRPLGRGWGGGGKGKDLANELARVEKVIYVVSD